MKFLVVILSWIVQILKATVLVFPLTDGIFAKSLLLGIIILFLSRMINF
jgi:hypothetical protein